MTKDATVDNVKSSIHSAAQTLEPNDYFFLSYSGHGGQLRDENNDEDDYLDETWCLYDRQFVDDELNSCLRDFKEGVKIFVLSDSCHSGTVVKGEALQKNIEIDKFNSNVDKKGNKYRFAPDIVLSRTYDQNKAVYDRILGDVITKKRNPLLQFYLYLAVRIMNYRRMGRIMATLHQVLRKFGMMANLMDPIKNFIN